MLFSKRKGLSPVRDAVQKEGMDDALRHGLWNTLHLCIWQGITYNHYSQTFRSSNLYDLFQHYWHNLFKIPLDNLPEYLDDAHKRVRKYFFECDWYEAYDFIEFTAQNCPEELKDQYVKFCNHILEKELSAYRFVDSQLTDITSEEEIESIDSNSISKRHYSRMADAPPRCTSCTISSASPPPLDILLNWKWNEAAIGATTKYSGANKHVRTALGFLSDRKSPDYRNSVKESISAVESLCVSISGDPKATLGAALNSIERTHQLHPAFKKALSSLYGYTSDSDGIRHALLEESSISYSDAKFMLVACSAFVNYVFGKTSEKS